ncbi:cupin-like domain containing protein [Nitzschia inconspicua]|uniref:Cupin-like domain containing protein n=1 Tax=Nitzschia inconspicua TaxID=303405 RepID=A0A9K3PNT9_9STRA|nr:cupin-like domain containing protein [Nitzschia inconspicua]
MHQRRSGPSASAVPPGGDILSAATSDGLPPPASSSDVRKRRKKKVATRNVSPMARLSLQLRQIFQDEDTLVTVIQALSIIILMGCGIALMLHYFGTPSEFQDGDDHQQPQQQHGAPVPFGVPSSTAAPQSWFWSTLSWVVPNSGMMGGRRSNKRKRMPNGLFPRIDLKPSSVYDIPDTLSFVGDKSDHYATLRKEYDAKMDELPNIQKKYTFAPMAMTNTDDHPLDHDLPEPYDIYNCPEYPPKNYPYDWNLLQVLKHWEPDDPTIPSDMRLFQGLCVFDYQKDYDKAVNYRRQELPFVVVNDPQVQQTVKRWNAPGYMEQLLGNVRHRAEYSESNHFLYWNKPAGQLRHPRQHNVRKIQQRPDLNPLIAPEAQNLKNWKEPTQMLRMTYLDWLARANLTETGAVVGPNDPHWYFRLIGCGETGPEGECDQGSSEYLFDELPFFQPRETLYVVDPMEQKGIHCRFGMHGVIAENHFDQSRNAIVVLGGERRYVLAHPNQCKRLSLLPKGHPSARHSAVDWSDPDLDSYPEFAEARGNEVVLQPGDVLYLPTNWFHYIISLNLNFQCNTRSGVTPEYMKPIRECGF